MLSNSPAAASDDVQPLKILAYAATVIFGVDPDNVSSHLTKAAYLALTERFSGLTILDMQTAYRNATAVRKSAYTVTREELIEPIVKYWEEKSRVVAAIEGERQRLADAEAVKVSFRKQAEAVYLKSLDGGAWVGDPFQANYLAKDYKAAGWFKEKELEQWKKQSIDQHTTNRQQVKVQLELNQFAAVIPEAPAEFLYSQIIITQAVKRGLKLIVE